MNDAKAGKGYRDGKPLGVLKYDCKECGGQVVAIKMNTNCKGFETTSEQVCTECGLVYPTAMDLHKLKDTSTCREFPTHDSWIEYTKEKKTKKIDDRGVDEYQENAIQLYGHSYDGVVFQRFKNMNDSSPRVAKAIKRLSQTNPSKNIPRHITRTIEYHKIADDYIHELNLNELDAKDVHYHIDHRKNMFNTRYKMEDVIFCTCIYVMSKRVTNSRMSVIKRQTPAWKLRLNPIYQTIKQKLDKEPVL